jgi:hypothetical protein
MKSRVYFVSVKEGDTQQKTGEAFDRLISKSGILDTVGRGRAVIKMHFGEEGNTGFIDPYYVRLLVDELADKGMTSFLADTNTLYKGRRTEPEEHAALAAEHGFTFDNTGAQVIIPDENEPGCIREIPGRGDYIARAKLADLFLEQELLVDLAHFKGHLMTGFGGAIKNLGMGCAVREGKLEQHTDLTPEVFGEKCSGCGKCAEVCPAGAVSVEGGVAVMQREKCIGCADCIAACPTEAMNVRWEHGADTIQEKMAEYAAAVLDGIKGAAVHINFAVKITKECDCLAKDDPRICPDIGIFASVDPVSLDKACLDMAINKSGRDIFSEAHPDRDGMKQLIHAQKLGIGNIDHELIELSG